MIDTILLQAAMALGMLILFIAFIYVFVGIPLITLSINRKLQKMLHNQFHKNMIVFVSLILAIITIVMLGFLTFLLLYNFVDLTYS